MSCLNSIETEAKTLIMNYIYIIFIQSLKLSIYGILKQSDSNLDFTEYGAKGWQRALQTCRTSKLTAAIYFFSY